MDIRQRLSAYARQNHRAVYPSSQDGSTAWVHVGDRHIDASPLPVALWNVDQWATPSQRRRAIKKSRRATAHLLANVPF